MPEGLTEQEQLEWAEWAAEDAMLEASLDIQKGLD